MELNIRLVEQFPYSMEVVWRALTDPGALRVWLMDNDFEARVGKRFILRGREKYPEWRGWVECKVLELDAPNRMVWSWVHDDSQPPTLVEFQLEPILNGTRLTLSHTGEVDPFLGSRLREGWPGKLADLFAHLSRAV
jgi:uncharacterized protein YndB with AHSA1/START domain